MDYSNLAEEHQKHIKESFLDLKKAGVLITFDEYKNNAITNDLKKLNNNRNAKNTINSLVYNMRWELIRLENFNQPKQINLENETWYQPLSEVFEYHVEQLRNKLNKETSSYFDLYSIYIKSLTNLTGLLAGKLGAELEKQSEYKFLYYILAWYVEEAHNNSHFSIALKFYEIHIKYKTMILGEIDLQEALRMQFSQIGKHANKARWQPHREKTNILKEKYLNIMTNKGFTNYTQATDYIFANENPEQKSYRWIYDTIRKADKPK